MVSLAPTTDPCASMSRLSVFTACSGTACVEEGNGGALRGTCRSPGVTPRARSLGRYTLPPRRRADEQHPPRTGAIDAALSLTPTAPTAFLCSHPCRRKGGLTG